MAKLTPINKKKARGPAAQAKKKVEEKPAKLKEIEDDDDDVEDDDSDDLEASDLLAGGLGGVSDDDDDISEDDDDDDDMDDDDDEDDDEDDEDDDEDDDDDDDEEEIDDDDDDEDEDEEPVPKLLKTGGKNKATPKGKNNSLSPTKKNEKPTVGKKRQNSNSEGETKAKKSKPQETHREDREEKNKRVLYIKGFLPNTTVESLKALSPDIINVHKTKPNQMFAFLEFESEAMAEKNHKILQNAKLEDKTLFVDYAGKKSKSLALVGKQKNVDEKTKLYLGGLKETTTEEDLKKAFPNSAHVVIKKGKTNNFFAFVTFKTEAEAKSAVNVEVVVGEQQVKPSLARAQTPKPNPNQRKGNFNQQPKKQMNKNPNNKPKQNFGKKNKAKKSSNSNRRFGVNRSLRINSFLPVGACIE